MERPLKRARTTKLPIIPMELWAYIWVLSDTPLGNIILCCKEWARSVKYFDVPKQRFYRLYDGLHLVESIVKQRLEHSDFFGGPGRVALQFFTLELFPLIHKYSSVIGGGSALRSLVIDPPPDRVEGLRNPKFRANIWSYTDIDIFVPKDNVQSFCDELAVLLENLHFMQYGALTRSCCFYGMNSHAAKKYGDMKICPGTFDIRRPRPHQDVTFYFDVVSVPCSSDKLIEVLCTEIDLSFCKVFCDTRNYFLGKDLPLEDLYDRQGTYAPKRDMLFTKARSLEEANSVVDKFDRILWRIHKYKSRGFTVTDFMEFVYEWMECHNAKFSTKDSHDYDDILTYDGFWYIETLDAGPIIEYVIYYKHRNPDFMPTRVDLFE